MEEESNTRPTPTVGSLRPNYNTMKIEVFTEANGWVPVTASEEQ